MQVDELQQKVDDVQEQHTNKMKQLQDLLGSVVMFCTDSVIHALTDCFWISFCTFRTHTNWCTDYLTGDRLLGDFSLVISYLTVSRAVCSIYKVCRCPESDIVLRNIRRHGS